MNLNCYVVEYSPEQECFHIETVKEYLETNYEIFLTGINGASYIMLSYFNTIEEAQAFCNKLKKEREWKNAHKV
jgi:hypothetical protein